jgi:hypothetical protein
MAAALQAACQAGFAAIRRHSGGKSGKTLPERRQHLAALEGRTQGCTV